MKVFISWSGDTAKQIASVMSKYLELIIPEVICFVSADELEKGSRWSGEIAKELEESNYGILILNKGNLAAPWVFFEAGALSKSLERARVAPVLFGVEVADISATPLVQFQCVFFRSSDFVQLCEDLARVSGGSSDRSKSYFLKFWPDLETEINNILAAHGVPKTSEDPTEAALRDISRSLRLISLRTGAPEKLLPIEYLSRALAVSKDEDAIVRRLTDHIEEVEKIINDISEDAVVLDTDDIEELQEFARSVERRCLDLIPLDVKEA